MAASFLKLQFVKKVKAGVEFRHVQSLNRNLSGGCQPGSERTKKYDDQADSTSQALDWLKQRYFGPTVQIFEVML